MEVTVKDRQTLADIAIQTLGSVEAIFNLAVRNQLSITAELDDGDTLQWDIEDIANTHVREKYAALRLYPATDISSADYDELITATDEYSSLTIYDQGRTFPDYNEDENIYTTLQQQLYAFETTGEMLQVTTAEIQLTRIFQDPFSSTFA